MISTLRRHSTGLRRLHWLMALLILLVYLAIEQRGLFPRATPERAAMMQAHFWLGLTVLVLVLWRVRLRLRHGAPSFRPPLPRWQSWPAAWLHVALYACLFVMPVLGLLTAWADGKTLYWPLTQTSLPALIAPDPALGERLETLHGSMGEAFYWIIGLHVLAALYHRFVQRDGVFERML